MGHILGVEACYAAFREITRLMHACTKVEDIAEVAVFKITRAFSSKGALLQLYDSSTGQLTLHISYGLEGLPVPPAPLADPPQVREICTQRKVLVVEDIAQDSRFPALEKFAAAGIGMVAAAPLGLREDFMGLMWLGFPERRDFTEEELDFLAAVTQQCTGALDKALLIEKQQEQFDQLAYQTERLTALGRLAASVTHELNNPLSSILLYSSNMKKKVPPEGFLHEGLDIIMQETKRCKNIIQDLQEFSRSKEPKKTVGNITQILEKVLSLLENEFRKYHIQVRKEVASHLPDLLIDVGQMQQVFANLLINAIEAAGARGEIRIRTRFKAEQQVIEIEIADNGAGIPPEQLPRIFEPFFSTKAKGTGLGLAITYGFIINHQGDIKVESRPEEGTRFLIQLPITTNNIAKKRALRQCRSPQS